MTSKDLKANEYNPYYQTYIDKAAGLDLSDGLRSNFERIISFLKSIPKEKLEYRYAEGKWTIKEIILHLIDTERIFVYRALRVSRHDPTALPGFDQDNYVPASKANTRTIDSLLEEYRTVREATISLFNTFDDSVLCLTGTASNSNISVRAIGFITLGHENHHCEVIKERYLN